MKTSLSHRELAELGARARLAEIDRERAELLRAFPGIQRSSASHAGPGAVRRSRTISPAAKKRMSAGMRKYWARRKAQQAQRKQA
jgi:hypothetical protein